MIDCDYCDCCYDSFYLWKKDCMSSTQMAKSQFEVWRVVSCWFHTHRRSQEPENKSWEEDFRHSILRSHPSRYLDSCDHLSIYDGRSSHEWESPHSKGSAFMEAWDHSPLQGSHNIAIRACHCWPLQSSSHGGWFPLSTSRFRKNGGSVMLFQWTSCNHIPGIYHHKSPIYAIMVKPWWDKRQFQPQW